MAAIDTVIGACEANGLRVSQFAGWFRCAHPCSPDGDEKRRSFAFKETADGTVVVRSHKPSYEPADCIKALGLTWADFFPETNQYEYTDASGRPIGRVTRKPGKEFPQGHYDRAGNYHPGLGDVILPLYLAPLVADWVEKGRPIFVVEGEKDVRSLVRRGFPATTKSGGAKSPWQPDHVRMLTGADITVVMDKDDAGLSAAIAACEALQPVAKSLRIVQAAKGHDATDHLDCGYTPDQFVDRSDLVPPVRLLSSTGKAVSCVDVADVEDAKAQEGVPTGFKSLDAGSECGGLPKGQMTVWAARKKVGKTSGMTQVAAHACDKGFRVLYVTLADLTPPQVWRRMRRQATGWADAPYDLQRADDWNRQIESMKKFWELKFANAHMIGGRNVEDLVPGITALHLKHGFDLVVLDYAQKATSDKNQDRVRALEEVSQDLAFMADAHGFALLVGSQLTESGQTRYSQEFEDDCGLMVRVSAPDGLESPRREFEVPYSRFGPSFSFNATWNETRLRFDECD